MLSFLQGQLVEACPQHIIVQVGGLGIKVNIPPSFYFDLPGPGAEITVHTVLQLKDDEALLYGFHDSVERDFFKILTGVTGIGPKVALALLGHLTLPRLVRALETEDLQALSAVPGIGPKTARRLIYELKEKIATLKMEETGPLPTREVDSWLTVEEALLGLGYAPREIARARNLLGKENGSVEEIFKKALSILAGE
ncbi:MAG: Holliday junction branch migration protein RuvA [Bacillota bacterium]